MTGPPPLLCFRWRAPFCGTLFTLPLFPENREKVGDQPEGFDSFTGNKVAIHRPTVRCVGVNRDFRVSVPPIGGWCVATATNSFPST